MKHIYCPCIDCKNVVLFDDTELITSHLVCQRFINDHLIWTKHGENSSALYTTRNSENIVANGFLFVHETQLSLP